MKIYLARPISGLTFEEVVGYYEATSDELRSHGYGVLCPMTGKGYLRNETEFRAYGYDNPVSTNRAIVGRDHWMVEQSDVVFVDLTGAQKVSIGCVSELAWAYHLRKHIVLSLDNDFHKHAFVLEMADVIFPSYEEAMRYLKILADGRIRTNEPK